MNEEMYQAMALQGEDQAMGAFSQDDPEAPIPMTDSHGQIQMIDPIVLAAEGMAFAGNYMSSNGPTQANHIGRAKTMTKRQLKEQQMNEENGYPSSLKEVEKVQELESKMESMEAGISQILSHLNGQSSQVNQVLRESIGGNLESLAGVPTPMPEAYETAIQQSQASNDLNELSEPVNKQPRLRQVTLKDGRKISVPDITPPANPMSLGPAAGVQEAPPNQFEDQTPDMEDLWDNPIAVIPKDELVPAPTADPILEKVQMLVQEVNQFMQTNDIHRFWRRHLSNNLHRHVGYNGWPRKLQTEFDTRFKGFLQDPQFVTSICRKIIQMEMGYALGVKHVVSFMVSTAGFTAFALCGIDD